MMLLFLYNESEWGLRIIYLKYLYFVQLSNGGMAAKRRAATHCQQVWDLIRIHVSPHVV